MTPFVAPPPRIAILGRGPSAAYAYRACADAGIAAHVYGPKGERPHGAFWLHRLPTSVLRGAVDPLAIHYMRVGTPEGYSQKIWGHPYAQTSFPKEEGPVVENGWPPDWGLGRLWDRYEQVRSPFTERKLGPEDVEDLCHQYDLVLQTFPPPLPANLLERLRKCVLYWERPSHDVPGNRVIYNGELNVPWVRFATIAGEVSYEFPGHLPSQDCERALPVGNWRAQVWPDLPPLEDTEFYTRLHHWHDALEFDAPKNLILLGRYAQGNRRQLSHEAYEHTLQHLWKHFHVPRPLIVMR